jgi:hypothetical protein
MAITAIIKNCRASFTKNLVSPSEAKGNKPGKYSVNGILDSKSQIIHLNEGKRVPVALEDRNSLVELALKQKFNGKVPPKWDDWAFRKNTNSVSATTGERWAGYEDDNGLYVSPSRTAKVGDAPPLFVRKDGSLIDISTTQGMAEASRLFYAGCRVNLKINIGAYEAKEDNVTKRGVTTFLEAIQFAGNDEPLTASATTAEGFEDESDDNDNLDDL